MNGIRTAETEVPTDVIAQCTEFLESYYQEAVAVAAKDKEESVTVEFSDIYRFNPDLSDDLVNHPWTVIKGLRKGIIDVEVPLPNSQEILKDVDVRVSGVRTNQPIVSNLRDERHRTKYIGLRGQVSLATQVKPKLMHAMLECKRCDDMTVGPVPQSGDGIDTVKCPSCGNRQYELKQSESIYLDHQIIELTDPPGENPGETGNVVPVHLYGELAGRVKPGDRIRVNGIATTPELTLGKQSESRRQDWELIGHAIDEEETAFEEVEAERVDEIEAISNRENVKEIFVRSFAPDILTGERGDKHKLAVLLSLFGGSSNSDRDDINVFFIGAPGTGKSAYLKRAKELAPKAVQASGKGATAAGLTATATKSDTTGKWMLDAGALVLASGGVACVDEFDKMADSVRQSMHEAMENQEVPINKAGINTTLTTETTVIAAANPKKGSFNRFENLAGQVEIGSPLLSRFDLIFGIGDEVSESKDSQIAKHQHDRIEGDAEKELEDSLITEYIAYARQNVHPTYESEEPKQVLVDYYVNKRQESNDEEDDTITPVTPRMNDALRRIAQASARMHLRETITVEDAEIATDLMDMKLGDTALEEDGRLNGGASEGRTGAQSQLSRRDRLKKTIRENNGMERHAVKESMQADDETVENDIEKLKRKGILMEPEQGFLRVT